VFICSLYDDVASNSEQIQTLIEHP